MQARGRDDMTDQQAPIDEQPPATGEGRRVVRELIDQADVVIENFKPGTLEK